MAIIEGPFQNITEIYKASNAVVTLVEPQVGSRVFDIDVEIPEGGQLPASIPYAQITVGGYGQASGAPWQIDNMIDDDGPTIWYGEYGIYPDGFIVYQGVGAEPSEGYIQKYRIFAYADDPFGPNENAAYYSNLVYSEDPPIVVGTPALIV